MKARRIVVHDGTGHCFWLAPNQEPEKLAAAKIDWSFTVWLPASWEQLRKLPADLNPTGPGETSPPSQIDVYTAGIDWAAVTVPAGIEVVDQRLVAHGFTVADGAVLEGKVTDLTTGQPLAATMRLQRVEPQQKGGYLYPAVAEAKADAQGRWVLKKAPAGWVRVVVEADGFVPASPAMPGSTTSRAGSPTTSAWPAPPRSRAGSSTRTGSRWRTSTCVSATSRPRPAANTSHHRSMNSRRTPTAVSGPSRPGRHGVDLGPQAGLLRPRPGPSRQVAGGERRDPHEEGRERPGHCGFRGEEAGR